MQFPIGGTAHEQAASLQDLVKFQGRRYSPDERRRCTACGEQPYARAPDCSTPPETACFRGFG